MSFILQGRCAVGHQTTKQDLDHPPLMDSVDPSWDRGNYPYYKAVPVPANTSSSSSSPSFGVLVRYPESPHVFPTGGYLCRECRHGYCAQPAHGIRGGRRNKRRRRRPHHSPDIVHWRPDPIGCPCCCGQSATHHHADSVPLCAAPVSGATPGGDIPECQPEAIDERRRCGAPVRCLPDSPEAVGSTKQMASCCNNYSSSNPNIMSDAAIHRLILLSGAAQPKNIEENLTRKSLESQFMGLGCEDQSNSTTNVDISGLSEGEKELPASTVTGALLISQPGINSGLKAASRTATVAPQMTPLYGRPAWWGDDPEQEINGQWKHNHASANSTVYSMSSSVGVRLAAISTNSDDAVPSIKSLSEAEFKSLLDKKATNESYSDDQRKPDAAVYKASVAGDISLNGDDEKRASSSDEKYAGHAAPERCFGTAGIQAFLRPDPPPTDGAGRPASSDPGPPNESPATTPTAFVVDLGQHSDDDAKQAGGGGDGGGVQRITVGTRLSEFLPTPLVRSLQRRLSRMRRTQQERRTPAAADQRKHRTKPKKDSTSFDDVIAVDDATADDVSDAGTYTVDVCSDEDGGGGGGRGEAMGPFDAKTSILVEFGINATNALVPNSTRFRPGLAESTDLESSPETNVDEEQKSDERIDKSQMEASSRSCPVTGLGHTALLLDNIADSVCESEKSFHGMSKSGNSFKSRRRSDTLHGSSPRTSIGFDNTEVVLHDSNNLKAGNDESRTSTQNFSEGNYSGSRTDLDEDGSSVDWRDDDPISPRTVTSVTSDALLQSTEESVHRTECSNVQRQAQFPDNCSKVIQRRKEARSTEACSVASELSSCVSEEQNRKASGSKLAAKDVGVVRREKPVKLLKQSKTKSPNHPKTCPKNVPSLNYYLSTRRCFSELDVTGNDEIITQNASTVSQEGKATGPKAVNGSAIETTTRMNRTFALRRARREARDAGEVSRPGVLDPRQRYGRATKKNEVSKFDETKRSRSASRPRTTSSRAPSESLRSTETCISLVRRTVQKSQENEKKVQLSNAENGFLSRSFTRKTESSYTASEKTVLHFQAPTISTKKKTKADIGKVDALNRLQGHAVKGNTASFHSQTSTSSSLTDTASSEWTRIQQYNQKQSSKSLIPSKKMGKQDGRSTDAKIVHDKLDQRPRNKKKTDEINSVRSAPSTSSDWTDDEKLQMTPPRRELPTVGQLSAKIKLLSDEVLQAVRKRPEFKASATTIIQQNATPKPPDLDSLAGSSPESQIDIFHNLHTAERQLSDVCQVLSLSE